jgi:glucose/arabinose dehydrogenase
LIVRIILLAFGRKTKSHISKTIVRLPGEFAMRRRSLIVAPVIFLLLINWPVTTAQQPERKAYGLDKRVPWTTSKVIGSPEPPPPYKTEPAFPKLPPFEEPLDLTYAPGTNRLFVAGRWGKIWSFVNKKDVDKADLALELKDAKGEKQVIYAFTFHPKFKDNGFIYVTWIPDGSKEGIADGSRVSRFTVKGEPPVIDRASEKVIFTWPNGGHNGGCLKFGPDGYLYIVTGDGSGIADSNNIGQDLSSIHAKLLRIDVDNPTSAKPYSIPKENPFVKTKGARPEVYAYGLRQLWRFSFDRFNGDLWGGEVGQDLWEMIYKIEKGGNYGWSVMEGTHEFRPERKKGPTPILKPVVEHSHTDFRSITGGFVYHGRRLPELVGNYVYGDFDTGRVWDIREVEVKLPGGPGFQIQRQLQNREIARTTYRIVSWGEDADGEIYFCDFTGGGIHQLVKAPPAEPQAPFPRKLSETGIFASTKDHKVAAGVIPYSVNAQLWGDNAYKERFLAIPGNDQIGFDEITYPQPSPGAPPGWRFPDGTVLVKTFGMEMERGNPASKKRLETRILHFQQFPGTQEYGDQYWRGYTYVWNDDQTDAELLDEKGLDKKLSIKVGD